MPIRERNLTPPAPPFTLEDWQYTVVAKLFFAGFDVSAAKVSRASPQIHWMIGKRFDTVRNQISHNGWELRERAK